MVHTIFTTVLNDYLLFEYDNNFSYVVYMTLLMLHVVYLLLFIVLIPSRIKLCRLCLTLWNGLIYFLLIHNEFDRLQNINRMIFSVDVMDISHNL